MRRRTGTWVSTQMRMKVLGGNLFRNYEKKSVNKIFIYNKAVVKYLSSEVEG